MRSLLIGCLLMFFGTTAWATHNRAGEITYRHVSGTTYEIKITTYTKLSAPADREWMPINYGDGSPQDSIQRTFWENYISLDVRYNVYIKNHTFPGPSGPSGYRLLAEDPNRNVNILNLGNELSVNLVFAIETLLHINPVGGVNNSVQLLNPPLDEACLHEIYEHNPAAYDPDGDSLTYELVPCMGVDGENLPMYVDPDQIQPGANNNIDIDPVTGTVTWESPQQAGLYNIAILITEYRTNNITGQVTKVGSVIRDMQINVVQCDNQPPEIDQLPDTCVEAGSILNFQVNVTDPNNNPVALTAYGGPFEFDTNPAVFTQSSNGPGIFGWNTTCDHVRLAPYQVVFKATDSAPSGPLVSYSTMNITVVAPAPQNPEAIPQMGAIQLTWEESICDEANAYKIYRRAGEYGFEPDHCELGVPAYTGYELLATVDGLSNTSYFDEDNIAFGLKYCYMVVACFPDGAESYASEEFCAQIAAEIPLITHNSVGATDENNGRDTLRWQRPFDLDTLELFTGPYQYKVYRGDGYSNTSELIYTSEENSVLSDLPGELIVEDLDTETQPNVYQVELLNDGVGVTMSNAASSVFVSLVPNDEQITVEWDFNQPWVNFNYQVQQLTGDSEWETIDETGETSFVHEGLENGEEYCYRVIAYGSYFSEQFPDTLINYSQEICGFPFDNTPPCAPELTVSCYCPGEEGVEPDGDHMVNTLTWTNPNEECEETDDTQIYNIYFKPTLEDEWMLVDSVPGADNTTLEYNFNGSVSGCYAVTALDYDAVNDRRNESLLSEPVCCDNCPDYRLPDVFTPNNDGANDFFVPFPYRFVESIDLVIYNRWGQPVFETTDPDIMWDGFHKDSGERVSDGVYYYVCLVNTIRLEGTVTFELKGSVHVLDSKDVNYK